jgi:hypothetical protein
LSDVNITVVTPAAAAWRRLCSVVSIGLLRSAAARDLDHRAEVALIGAAAHRIDPEHRHPVALQLLLVGWADDDRLELARPALSRAVGGLQLAARGVLEDRLPDHLALGQREAQPAPVKLQGVAGHGMRTAHDAVLDAARAREGSQIERALELVRLHPDQSQQHDGVVAGLQQVEVIEVAVHVLVDQVDLGAAAQDLVGHHARQVIEGRVGHQPEAEAGDGPVGVVLARLHEHDAQALHGPIPLVSTAAPDPEVLST